jgi:hypothetical protein
MVVERDLPVHVWGMATPGEAVAVTFRGEMRTTKGGELGKWSVYLSPGAAGGPFEMTVKGTPTAGGDSAVAQTITLDDVLVGDAWVASGQSNMEFLMKQAATADQDLPHAANDKIQCDRFAAYLTGRPSPQNLGSIWFSPVRGRWSPKPKQAAPWLSKRNSCSGVAGELVSAIRLEPGRRLVLIIVIGQGGRIEAPTPAFSGRK